MALSSSGLKECLIEGLRSEKRGVITQIQGNSASGSALQFNAPVGGKQLYEGSGKRFYYRYVPKLRADTLKRRRPTKKQELYYWGYLSAGS